MEKTKKKNTKMIVLISIIVVIAIIGAAIGGYFIYKKIELDKPIETEWGQTYYSYIKEAAEDDTKKEVTGLKKGMEEAKIQFCDVEKEEEPVMVVSYKKDSEKYANIYYIDNEGVNYTTYDGPAEVEMLYSIE